MSHKLFQPVIGVALVMLFVVGCGSAPAVTPVAQAPGATPTPVPPTATSIPPTATPVPPTATPIPPTATPTLTPIPTRTWGKDGSVMVYVPEGEFVMGSPESDREAESDELPQHSVHLISGFWIGKYEVTIAQYKKCVEAGGCFAPYNWLYGSKPQEHPAYAKYPVTGVTWKGAVVYAKWVGGRLPTEAEWEKAACWDPEKREKRRYPWGDEFDVSKANTAEAQNDRASPVGMYSPAGDSPYGVADMAGNVYEWTSTIYRSYPYYPNDGREDLTASGDRVIRGGSFHWEWDKWYARCVNRAGLDSGHFTDDIGFRIVLDADVWK